MGRLLAHMMSMTDEEGLFGHFAQTAVYQDRTSDGTFINLVDDNSIMLLQDTSRMAAFA
jgi:hypothetical protein